MDSRGNVLVIGNSGVGKSTLINAVLGENRAETGWGISGTTDRLKIYEGKEELQFRLIDTVGFEPTFIKEYQAVKAVKKWSKECKENGQGEREINIIWFCVDGTSSKLFEQSIKNLSKATAMWKSVPVIVVITKSYGAPDREKNIETVKKAFGGKKGFSDRLKDIVPVVAAAYPINDTIIVPPDGIMKLINITNEWMPEGLKAGKKDLEDYKLNRKRAMAQSIVAVATATGTTVGAVPVPFMDAAILSPLEIGEVNAIARIYGIKNDEESKRLLNSIVEVGTVSAAAKTVISALKMIPGINLGASVLNALIAGGIITAIGEGCVYIFEQIYLGNKSVSDIDWVKKFMESKLSAQLVNKLVILSEQISDHTEKKDIAGIILDTLNLSKKAK